MNAIHLSYIIAEEEFAKVLIKTFKCVQNQRLDNQTKFLFAHRYQCSAWHVQ